MSAAHQETPASKLKIGIIGAGSIVRQRHLPGLAALDGVEIAAVCNSSYESSQRFCDEAAPHATPLKNWAELLMLPELDIVWIGTQPYMHAPITLSALEARRHVFCQARMAMNLEEAREMTAAAERSPELVTMLCPPPMGIPAGRHLVQLVSDGAIGAIRHLRLRSLSDAFLDPDAPAHWRQRRELSGLNVMTLGIYVEVLQRWFGPIAGVAALGKVFIPMRQGYRVEIPDVLNVVCEFENGALGTLEFSSLAASAPGDALEIYGAEGTLVYDFTSDTISLGRPGHPPAALETPPELRDQWSVEADFIAAVRDPGAPRPSPTFEEGLSYMRVVQAVADSIDQRRHVTIAANG